MNTFKKLILLSILLMLIPLTNSQSITTSTSTSTTIPVYNPNIDCTGTSNHYCTSVYKSISSIDKINAPLTAKCGETILIKVEWTGKHNSNDNHWGFFISKIYMMDSIFIDSCKSFKTDYGTNYYNMSCYVDMPAKGTIHDGMYNFWVTGEDYGGYCNPDEAGVDAQKKQGIYLTNCQTGTSTSTTTSPTTTYYTTISTTTSTTTSICCQPLSCSGTTGHYCSVAYKSVDSIDKIIAPARANCGDTIPVTIEWTGRHSSNDNHWGFFLELDKNYNPPNTWGVISSCKSFVVDSTRNRYTMSCNVKMPSPGINNPYQEGSNKLLVTAEDYGGYCNPNEPGVDAQNSTSITLLNCKITTTITSTTTRKTTTTYKSQPGGGGGGGGRALRMETTEGLNNPIVILVALIAIVVIIYGAFKFFAMPKKHR